MKKGSLICCTCDSEYYNLRILLLKFFFGDQVDINQIRENIELLSVVDGIKFMYITCIYFNNNESCFLFPILGCKCIILYSIML